MTGEKKRLLMLLSKVTIRISDDAAGMISVLGIHTNEPLPLTMKLEITMGAGI